MATKEKQTEMTKGYPIFEWRPGISITEKGNNRQSEENEIYSTHEENNDDNITENGEEEEIIEEETYEYEHTSDRENDPSKNLIKNKDQNE